MFSCSLPPPARNRSALPGLWQLAKADAKAVRAAAEDAAAAGAAAAEAEAAWAAAGVGSGGGGGENAMLFLECEVNGRALRAFVDTGAQVRVCACVCLWVCVSGRTCLYIASTALTG